MNASTCQRIWLPNFLFQSVIVGGGYATGCEWVECFLSAGPLGGSLDLFVLAVIGADVGELVATHLRISALGTLTWVLVLIVPLLTLGVRKIVQESSVVKVEE